MWNYKIMNPLQKLKQFFINLISSKSNKITSLNKASPNTQIKQVEHSHQQTTLIPFLEKNPEPVTEIPTIIKISCFIIITGFRIGATKRI